MNSRTRFVLPIVGVSLLFVAGCAHEETARVVAPTAQPAPAPVAVVEPAPTYTGVAVSVSSDIVGACKIVFNQVDRAPKFDFDKSTLVDQDRDVLDQVAKCVTTGPLKGRPIVLVGRTDPRGEVEYNFVLGAHRAETVGDYLTGLGVSKEKMVATTRGKLDATGTDDISWAQDRRVDIALM